MATEIDSEVDRAQAGPVQLREQQSQNLCKSCCSVSSVSSY